MAEIPWHTACFIHRHEDDDEAPNQKPSLAHDASKPGGLVVMEFS
jgi:hypothetical protein